MAGGLSVYVCGRAARKAAAPPVQGMPEKDGGGADGPHGAAAAVRGPRAPYRLASSAVQPVRTSRQVASKSRVYQGSATSRWIPA